MFALLGDIPFDLLQSPTGLNETHNANFAKHNVLAGKPRLQSTGLDLIQREMSLRLHYKLGNVESRFNAIVNAFQNQLPLPLIMGRSQFHGFFVIESIQSQTTQTNAQGVVLARDLSLRLQEVADVKPPSPKGLAVIENNLPPVLAKTLDSIQKAGSTAIDTIKQGLNVVQKVNSAINRASHIANTINTFADNPVAALSAMPNALQGLQGALSNLGGERVKAVVDGLQSLGTTLQVAGDVASGVQRTIDEITQLKQGVEQVINLGSGNMERLTDGVSDLIANSQITLTNLTTISENLKTPVATLAQLAMSRFDTTQPIGEDDER